jgi:hypothetical protein
LWRTVDVGRGKPDYRFWCGVCGQDWTAAVSALADHIATGQGHPEPISSYCECGSRIRVMAFGGTLQVDDQPLRVAELGGPAEPEADSEPDQRASVRRR